MKAFEPILMKTLPLILLLLSLLAGANSLSARESFDTSDYLFPGGGPPGGAGDFVAFAPREMKPEPAWSLRTGFRKGITDQKLEEEIFAAPDVAVLRSGYYQAWPELLAEFRESFLFAGPEAVASLAGTKPVLIIPSGGLFGLSHSAFFKASLSAYVLSGGVILCFAQQEGPDFSALPVPAGPAIEAAGWAEDSGPLFRASAIRDVHAVLSGTRRASPSVETDGYISAYPQTAKVLLSRPDGFPTLIVYPLGRGWVVVTSLFSDVSFMQGHLEPEERALVRDLLSWAKASGKVTHAPAGEETAFSLRIAGPEEREASFVKVMVMEPGRDKPKFEETLSLSVKAQEQVLLPFRFRLPVDARPGIYHIEYLLLDMNKRPLSPAVECAEGWFSVPQAVAPPPAIPRSTRAIGALPLHVAVTPVLEQKGDGVRVDLEIAGTTGTEGGHDLFAKMAGREKDFRIEDGRATVSFEMPAKDAGSPLAYAVYHSSGRSLARGSMALPSKQKPEVALDRPQYLPGQAIIVHASGLGSGEFTVSGLGAVSTGMISGNGTAQLAVPAGLPAGSYPVTWEFAAMDGARLRGELSAAVAGTTVKFRRVTIERTAARNSIAVTASFRVHATQALSGTLKLLLADPGGKTVSIAEKTVSLSPGDQDLSIPFSFTPERGGLWQLFYGLFVTLPEGPGFSREPLLSAGGRELLDVGDAALLGFATVKPLYYEASGAVEASGYVYTAAGAKLDIYADGKAVKKEAWDSPGLRGFSFSLPRPGRGTHALRAVVSGGRIKSAGELGFVYGARLPDLSVSIRTSEFAAPDMAVGIGIMNQGRTASGPCKAALYEGEPAKDGALISMIDVPPLEPGKQHVMIVTWPLAKKTGPRTLVAVADTEGQVIESSRDNNRAKARFDVPDVLLTIVPQKLSFPPDEPVVYGVRLANLTTKTYEKLSVRLEVTDPSGKTVSAETVPVQGFAPGSQSRIDRTLELAAPQAGIYVIAAHFAADMPLVSDSVGVTVLPELILKGSLEGTPAKAASCRPLEIRYRVRDAGTIAPANGSFQIEIRSAGLKQAVYSEQIPFSLGSGSDRIESVEFPRGRYTMTLRASASNPEQGLSRNFLLAEQELVVTAPLEVRKSAVSLPRVLVWPGSGERPIEQAVGEKILREAFQGVYYRIVQTAPEFSSQAESGLFSSLVIFEPDAALPADWLRNSVSRGHGVVLVGSGERVREAASAFGFLAESPVQESRAFITFAGDSGLGLTGKVPVSGPALSLRKKGATAAATFADGSPAIQLDSHGRGKVVVMPVSLVRSAIALGATSAYSLLVRSAAAAALPETGEPAGVSSMRITVSSPGGPVATRITETLPPGSRLVWSSVEGSVKDDTVTFDLTANAEPREILYLFREPEEVGEVASTEVFYECRGKFLSQGRVE